MYYGNPTVSANPSVKSVWTSGYKGVWHLNGNDFTDGTSNSNDGTNFSTTSVTGKIAGARGFNGTTQYISVPTSGFVPVNNNQTISIWANYPVAPTGARNLISFQTGTSGSAIQLGFRDGNAVAWKWGGVVLASGGAAPSTNAWHYYVYTYDGTTSSFYIDGVLMGSSTVAPQTLTPNQGNIGRYNNGEYLNANLDEPRFSMSPKSAGWVLTEYNNQNDPANFIALGTEVDATLLTTLGVCSTTYPLNQGFPAGGTYSGPGVSGTNFNASVAGVGTHPITYFYTDGTGCSNSAIKNIVVTPVPAAPAASNKLCCFSNIVDLEATGTNIRWYSDAGLTTLVGTGTPFATGRTAAGVYTYYATQTINGCQSAATTVTLTITSGTTIVTQPQPTSICTSGSGTFSVVATGFNLSYRWQEAGVNISDGGIYSGATSPTLTITNPGIAKSGLTYRCVITSTCGTPTTNSAGAILTVTTLPVATFSYTGTPYCSTAANPLPTFSGGGVAGTFSSTAGLVFVSTATGRVNLSASTPGTYTVTNTIAAAGGCGIVTATSPITISAEGVWTGALSTDWNVAGNWSCLALPTGTSSVQIPNVSNKPTLAAGGVGIVKDLTIDAGSSLTISGNTIRISGTITNNGTLTATSGTVELNGTSAQTIGANTFSGNTIRNLIINNAAGVNLGGSLYVTGILTPNNGVLNTGDSLTLISDASGTALISGSGTGTVTGDVTMQRYLPFGFGYKYFSSPFTAATVAEFTDEPITAIFRYDENRLVGGNPVSGWVDYSTPANPLNPLTGYAVNFGSNPASATVEMTGEVNNGPISIQVYNNNQFYTQGLNLIGNPYPSPVNWDLIKLLNTNVDDAIYYFKASTTDEWSGSYSSYIGGFSSDGLATNVIPSMQGFFVHVTNGAFPVTGTINMNNSVRMTDQTHGFLKSGKQYPSSLIRLTAAYSADTALYDPLVVYLNEKATIDFDSQGDALKLFNTAFDVPNFYSRGNDATRLSINGLPFPEKDSTIIPLGIRTELDGYVSFRIRHREGAFSSGKIFFIDLLSGTTTELLANNEYKTYLAADHYQGRFFLKFSGLMTSVPDEPVNSNLFNAWFTGGVLKAEIDGIIGNSGTVMITSLTGQALYLWKVFANGYHEFLPQLTSGIYIVTYTSGYIRISKRLFIY